MSRQLLFGLLVGLAACTGGPIGPGDSADTSDSGDDSTNDTFEVPVFDTADSDTTVDSGDSGDTGSDTDPDTDVVVDTAGGLFGEIPDCNGNCFPAHLVGDGFCDDGSQLPADFDCAANGFDGGDCNNTGPGTGCDYALLFTPRSWSNEIHWELETPAGTVIAKTNPGDYPSNNRTYRHDVFLSDGTYILDGFDTFGDGWHNAKWKLVDVQTGAVVAENNPSDFTSGTGQPPGDRYQWTFDVTCDRTACDADIKTVITADPSDKGWELWTLTDESDPIALFPVSTSAPGSLGTGTANLTTNLFQGRYELRTRDASGTGWDGDHVVVSQPGGYEVQLGSVPEGARTDAIQFHHDCGLGSTPNAYPDPIALAPVTCQDVTFQTRTRSGGNQVGWELRRLDTFQRVTRLAPGAVSDNDINERSVDLTSGAYIVRFEDSARDGWGGARLRIIDDPDAAALVDLTLPAGGSTVAFLDLDCPEIDTGDTSDTDEVGPTCLDGAIPDCRGVCMPEEFIGDGACDDGVQSSADFNCQAFLFDRGDCPPPDDTDDTDDTDDSGDTGDSDDTGDTGDSDDTGDTDDSGDTGDTADSGDSADTADSDDSGDTGDTADSGDSDSDTDTGRVPPPFP